MCGTFSIPGEQASATAFADRAPLARQHCGCNGQLIRRHQHLWFHGAEGGDETVGHPLQPDAVERGNVGNDFLRQIRHNLRPP